MLDSVELNISIDELSKSDNDVINNNITIKRNSLNDSKIFMKNLYIEINNIISSNFICVEKLKEVLTLLIPIILCSSSLNIITLKTKEKIEMLNSASNILKKLILENENANFIIELSDNSIIKKLTN